MVKNKQNWKQQIVDFFNFSQRERKVEELDLQAYKDMPLDSLRLTVGRQENLIKSLNRSQNLFTKATVMTIITTLFGTIMIKMLGLFTKEKIQQYSPTDAELNGAQYMGGIVLLILGTMLIVLISFFIVLYSRRIKKEEDKLLVMSVALKDKESSMK